MIKKLTMYLLGLLAILFVLTKWLYPAAFEWYTGVENRPLAYESSRRLSETEFERLADALTYEFRRARAEAITAEEEEVFARRLKIDRLMNTRSFLNRIEFSHIDYFRKAGIRQYEGPDTCLQCHEKIKIQTAHGIKSVDLMDDVVNSVHYKFQRTAPGFTTYGYDGREVNAEGSRPIPVGKIDRACGIPGSFSWTGWAELIKTKPDGGEAVVIRSEGCGQCHIGGNYHPATEKMMPVGDVPESAKQGIDCLICHSQKYDMNYRYIIEDEGGRRWNQDRTLAAALTVTLPDRDNCLLCHQHNMGGDSFAGNVSAKNLGFMNQRLLHHGAKRANPFSPETDVHAAAGMTCTDCHVPEGHKIPRGTKGTDLVANDLPGKTVECETCHTAAPHIKGEDRALLNGHVARVACESCHILHLEEYNVVLRDWVHPTWNKKEGIWEPTDIYYSGEAKKGFVFLWFNGYGTFLANALGDNPLGGGQYNPLMEQMAVIDNPEVIAEIRTQVEKLKETYADIDVEEYLKKVTNPLSQMSPQMVKKRKKWIEEKIRPLMAKNKSRIYPFKLFNAMMYEDMSNKGPFGAMILPFDYPAYYETGDPLKSVIAALQNPIIKRMYELPFKVYMMDEFMKYFGVDEWSNEYPLDEQGRLRNVKVNWMRQMGTLMVNHGIQKEGRSCRQCHHSKRSKGLIDFESLGYPPERVKDLRNLPELE
ncbi:MAG: nitrite reductase [Gammaproteobacteria bacterium]|nr:nitrite reductase [Gammaproteobacteria bacterium]